MVKAAFDRALERTLGYEGGTSDSPIDRGGFTHRGITQHIYDRWRVLRGLAKQPVVLIEDAELRELALQFYWKPCGCELLPDALALLVFDMAVNSGQSDAIDALQIAVGAKVDGVIGPVTIALARAADAEAPLRYLEARAEHIRDTIGDDPQQIEFLLGWTRRILRQAWLTAKESA